MLNSINRFTARTFSLVVTLAAALAVPASADAPIAAVYQGQTIRFTHVASSNGGIAIGVNDPGFQTLLHSTGAILTWKPGERYILITTSVPTVVSFAIDDRRYDVGPVALEAAFAPYESGNEVFLPFNEVLHSLDLALRQDARGAVLQPQLDVLDVRQESNGVRLLVHGGAPLRPRIVAQNPSAVTYAFDGVGTTLAGTRRVSAGGVRSVEISASGSLRTPTTLVTLQLAPGTVVQAPQNIDDRDVVLAVNPNTAQPAGIAEESPTPEPAPQANVQAPVQNAPAANGAAVVTAVQAQSSPGGAEVTIAITGNAAFEWHRLREPDNRFWVDVHNAALQGPPLDQGAPAPIVSLRVRQVDPGTVRIALSLSGPNAISLAPSASGLVVEVGTQQVADEPRSGSGSVGSVLSANEQNAAPVTPAPLDNASSDYGSYDASNWKFGPRSQYVPTNPRLIVIDPGHGGSDRGTMHGGVAEADLTLDMAKRLRDILIARGWQVKMTRDADVDVYAPNDSAHDELQARADVANHAGARLFVSIHVNAFINAGPYGTTCYISKPDDYALARSVERALSADGTKDDGIVRSHLYVTLHTRMPAVLIETAFLSNPGDYALVTSAAWREQVAHEIADGIGQYTQQYPVPNQPAQ